MNYFATSDFWYCYRQLPPEIQELADKNFFLLRQNPSHPSLRLKKIGAFWSVRVGLRFRALARDRTEGLVWFWIGSKVNTSDCSKDDRTLERYRQVHEKYHRFFFTTLVD